MVKDYKDLKYFFRCFLDIFSDDVPLNHAQVESFSHMMFLNVFSLKLSVRLRISSIILFVLSFRLISYFLLIGTLRYPEYVQYTSGITGPCFHA